MAFDYKKEYKEFYLPKGMPSIVDVPEMSFVAVRGRGDPNLPDGEYKRAIGVLYALAFTVKMSRKSGHEMDGYFEYVVPPLEGFWYQEGVDGMDYAKKADLCWISAIRLPKFVDAAQLDWAKREVEGKKGLSCEKAEFYTLTEGLCVQLMHTGAFDDEPESVRLMDGYIRDNGYVSDFSDERLHHEIYLSDARRVEAARLRTVIRHPVRRAY